MTHDEYKHIIPPPSVCSEIKAAIKKLKNHKSAGRDNITPELFKTDPAITAEVWISNQILNV